MAEGGDLRCVTRKVIRQRCAPEEVEPGKHVYRCEKKVETLRDCFGRPTEVIESHIEVTEHEMDGNFNQGTHFSMEQNPSSSITNYSRSWDRDFTEGLDDAFKGVETMTGAILGEMKRMAEEAERMTGSLFGFPYFPGEERGRRFPPFPVRDEERKVNGGEKKCEMQESLYSEFADKVREV